MKMTGFIVGGVLGMVGAFALMQRKPGVAKVMQGAMNDVRSNVMSTAVSKFMKSSKSGSQQQGASSSQLSQSQAPQQSQSASKSSGQSNHQHHPSNHVMNVSMIEGIIKNDPELQSAVEEIKSEAKSVH